MTPDEDRIDYAITQLSNAVWEKLRPRIDEEIFQAQTQIHHSRQGRELHAWNPNPVQREEHEEPAIIEDDPEEEEADEEEEEHKAWHNAWQDASWQDYDNDDNAEEGQEPRREVVEDAVMLPASIQIHDSSNIQR